MLTTPEQINLFRVSVIHRAIGLYLNTGMQASRMYTPQAMRNAAAGITGNEYNRSRKGLEMAHADLADFISRRV
jgi:hypothetical protein